ncbi:hypothetical protein INT45_009701 [Circinella minor]|uniref:Uncharacterized protein n=1 Tax=Circinella minor TaxID=1195481 RepID=A0A8H7RSL7_9FUNG|nr:hypothetical protein INT45_009701 [Circinella minor]
MALILQPKVTATAAPLRCKNRASGSSRKRNRTEVTGSSSFSSRTASPESSSPASASSGDSHESSSTTIASTESTSKRRKRIIDYFAGKDVSDIKLNEDATKWYIDGTDITDKFLKYREKTVEKAKKGRLETYQEELSINCIFAIDDLDSIYPNSTLGYGFDDSLWMKMTEECNDLYPLQPLPVGVEDILKKFDMAGKTKFSNCSNIVKSMETGNSEDSECIQDSLRSLSNLSLDIYSTDGKPINEKEKTVNFDYAAQMPKEALLIVEIKAPQKIKNGSRPDLVKLANEMKDALDKMIKDGLDDPEITVVGILIEGI